MEIGGGVLDNCASICPVPSLIAHFDNGYPSCILGEIKNRADVILYWGANPVHTHPRHMVRYAFYPSGFFYMERPFKADDYCGRSQEN